MTEFAKIEEVIDDIEAVKSERFRFTGAVGQFRPGGALAANDAELDRVRRHPCSELPAQTNRHARQCTGIAAGACYHRRGMGKRDRSCEGDRAATWGRGAAARNARDGGGIDVCLRRVAD